ncbi:MAG: MFS transporter [Desulforegulaceae bacterium]|nr:MFS transporter [Desulforegulaceae bacterium]
MESQFSGNKWLTFVLVAFGVFMSTLDGSIVNIALPAILDDFDERLAIVEWVVMIYLLTITSFLLACGKLSDIYGHKKIYIIGLLLFSLSSLMCGLSTNIYFLIFSRMFQGFSSAMIMACTPALLVFSFPESERGKVFGINAMVVALGLTSGPAIGGLFVDLYSWRMIFFINVPIGILGAIGSYFILKNFKLSTQDKDFDFKGSFFAAISIGSFLLVLTHGYEWGYKSFKLIGFSLVFLIFFTLFLFNEKNVKNPILNLKIFKNRMLSITSLSSTILFMILFIIIFLMPFYLIKAKGLDSTTSGYIMMTPFAFLFVVSPISGNLSDYLGSRILCTLGMIIIFFGVLLCVFLDIDSSIKDVVLRLCLIGIGTSIFVSPNSAALMTSIPENIKGTGGAIMAAARNLGMVLGIAMAGSLFNFYFKSASGGKNLSNYSPEMNPAFIEAFQFTMTATAVLALSAAVITAFRGKELKRHGRK